MVAEGIQLSSIYLLAIFACHISIKGSAFLTSDLGTVEIAG